MVTAARSPGRASQRPGFRCRSCGQRTVKWQGRCPECAEWGTIGEELVGPASALAPRASATLARPITESVGEQAAVRPTGLAELDRVLGGGLVDGAVVLLAGEPGIGKSTLLLEVAARVGSRGAPALVVSGEESAAQVRLRAERVGALSPDLFLAAETDLAAVLGHVEAVLPRLLVVDSVQTLVHPDVDGGPGSVSQVRESAGALIRAAKQRALPTLVVGHVTKDGSVAGPRVLEHLVDVVLTVEGERTSPLRMVRAVKNRFGPTDEVGCFELGESGLIELADPSGLFVSSGRGGVPGTCVTVTLEGRRPLVAEVQALVVGVQAPTPRRAVSGLDSARSAMLLAVLSRRAGVQLASSEVYLATVGGVRLGEPAVDLAAALAVVGAERDRPLAGDLIAVGEVGLAGEVRAVPGVDRRLAEAARLGFRTALVPAGSTGGGPAGMRVVEVSDVRGAIAQAPWQGSAG